MSVALAYDQWSSVYDTNVNPTRDLEAVALRDILDLKGFASAPADTRSIERILEVGCGTGKNTVYFAGREGARVVFSVDLSEKMLEKARDRLADAPPAKCKIIFQQADVLVMDDWKSLIKLGPNSSESMGDDDGDGVDLVSFSLVLEHMEDLSTVFAKAAAVTRAGGLLYVGELHPLKQYAGSKARFENESGETTVVTCFNHHVSDFLDAAAAAGYRLLTLKEFFDNDDRGSTPRILTMLFQKLEHRHYSVPKAARENNSLVARHNAAIQTREGMEVEICLSDIESAMAAQRGGATSVELCSDRAGGGVTPALGLIQECVRRLRGSVFVNVLIRPRVGDFVYSPAEVEVMLRDVEAARIAGADGVVVGALTPSGAIDELTVRRLRDAAGDMQLTFHRAIDVSSESIDEAVTKLARLGCDRILSSGMRRTAADGLEALAAMVRLVQERHYRIRVVAASGVNAGNACNIIASAGVHGVHAGSAVSLPRRNPSWWQWHFPSAPAVSMGTGGTETSDMEFPLVDESLVRAFVQSAMNR